jgi:hypothetical protein
LGKNVNHFKEGNYKLIKRSKPPEGATLFQVYGRRRERKKKPFTRKISKWKARRNVDERKTIKELHL